MVRDEAQRPGAVPPRLASGAFPPCHRTIQYKDLGQCRPRLASGAFPPCHSSEELVRRSRTTIELVGRAERHRIESPGGRHPSDGVVQFKSPGRRHPMDGAVQFNTVQVQGSVYAREHVRALKAHACAVTPLLAIRARVSSPPSQARPYATA